jgi:ABC-type Mn2+/Zn2+ transport system ATPase subunit
MAPSHDIPTIGIYTRCVGSRLVLQAVAKRYSWRGRWVLRGVSLEASPGTFNSIVGVNGSGKSTLLRIAAGLTSPTIGRALVPLRVGYLPERQPARLNFTAAEYLANMGQIRGMTSRAVAERGSELFERLGLQPNADVPWETLSKGNRQKVLVAQALLAPTDLVVLDEPYSGLDDRAGIALDELITEALTRETAVLISTHRTQDSHKADHQWQLESAGLTEISPSSAPTPGSGSRRKRIVLTTTQNRSPVPLSQFDGVGSFQTDGSSKRLVLIVSNGKADAVLRAALTLGWSVESVGRARSEAS